ncbi:unnamed protein product, partial [Hapterophycus canaliculatus]
PVPWDRDKGPGRDWVDGFLRRHPRVKERSTRIYEVKRLTDDDDVRLNKFYDFWADYVKKNDPHPSHNTDETGKI